MNSWFQFKQFIIHQDKCAMKVCTDACILGAWVAQKIKEKRITAKNVLDIGCGTGLLSLMIAQNTAGKIDAVEIVAEAFEQAKENAAAANRSEQVEIFKTAVQDFNPHKKYDLIVCNPPFYEDDLKSPEPDKNTAMHSHALLLKDFPAIIKNFLQSAGNAFVLLPYSRYDYFTEITKEQGLYINEILIIGHNKQKPPNRVVLTISNISQKFSEQSLFIRDDQNQYTPEFNALLADFYL
jgi:tRNA1Val (adenine37-N6)-methyltransferase